MKIFSSILLVSLLFIQSSWAQLAQSPAFSKKEVLEIMHRTNDYQLKHPVMKANDRNWVRATWYTGVMAAYQATGDESFLKQALDWGQMHHWEVGTESAGANRLFCVETWLQCYLLKKDHAMIDPTLKWVSTSAPNSPAGAKVWYRENGLKYADSLYGAAALAMLAKATNEHKYLDIMDAFFWDVQGQIFDKTTGLCYRDKRFIGKLTDNGKPIFWSRGNGWVLAGIARILEYMPSDDPLRLKYIEFFKTLAAAVAKRQGDDGFWRVNLEDPDAFNAPESSGSGFFCYALASGIRQGFIDKATYLPVVHKAWNGLSKGVTPEGRISFGQLVGDRPASTKQDDSQEYVTGTFLLAGSEMWRLAQ